MRIHCLQHVPFEDADSIARMIAHCSHELVAGPYVQPADELLAHRHRIEAARVLLYRLLDNLARQTREPA